MLYKQLTATFFAGSLLLLADVQYEQTSKVTGGSLANMPIVGSRIKEPTVTTHFLKGNRMAMVSKDTTMVYDLDKETITSINPSKREYSVMTFAEMREVMDKAMAKMQQVTQKDSADMKWNVKVDATGEAKEINGFDATKFIVTIDGDAKDAKTGKTAGTRMIMETWMAKGVPGGAEMMAFSKRMAEKLGAGRMGGINPMVQAQMGKGWYEAANQFAKMDGFNVLTITRMSTTVDGQPVMVQEGSQNAPHVDGGAVAKDAATSAATSAALGRLGRVGGIGSGIGSGLGGFGRKKKQEEPAPAAAPSATTSGTGMVPATVMEMQMDVNSMSTAPVDAAKFEVPAGFKQVESEMKKMAR